MKNLWLCLFVVLSPLWASASTTLIATYSGGQNPTLPAPDGTLKWNAESLASTNVITASVRVDDRDAWQMIDPGVPKGEGMNNLYYNARPTAAQIKSLVDFGFDIVLSMKIPGLEDAPGPAWTRDSNTSIGFYYSDPYVTNQRVSWSMASGRDALGNTLISIGGNSAVLTLSPEFHEYRFSYRDGLMTFYVDGVQRLTSSGVAAANTSAVNMFYWGDNNNATAASSYGERMAYFESVQLFAVPEPSPSLLVLLGVILGFFRRSR